VRASFEPSTTATKLGKRTYDYDACSGEPPSHDMVTNSEIEVCQFVAAAQPYFVSLAPTSAAYLPSWVSYFMSTVLVSIQSAFILRRFRKPDPTKKFLGIVISIGSAIFAFIKTAVAISRIVEHSESFETLPFISSSLWIDWLALSQTVWYFSPMLGKVVLLPTIAVYGMCSWLCVGYTWHGYGTKQYFVLDVPAYCAVLGIQWQTDPRRVHFLQLHDWTFMIATAAVFCGFIFAFDKKDVEELGLIQDPLPPAPNPAAEALDIGKPPKFDRILLAKRIMQTFFDNLLLFLCITIVSFAAIGTVMSAIINRYNFLLLGQQHCYASYVSSRFGYVDLYESDLIDTATKVMTWLGVHM
jgi:hypothetical protein